MFAVSASQKPCADRRRHLRQDEPLHLARDLFDPLRHVVGRLHHLPPRQFQNEDSLHYFALRRTGLRAGVSVDVTDIVYVDRVEAAWPLRVHLQPGSHVPIHCTSSGKLFLAHMPARQRRRLLYGAALKRFTGKTITDPARLESELTRIRKSKISTDDEGYFAGLISVAVPVLGRNRRMIATVAVHAPTARMSLNQALAHVGLLKQAASDLGRIYRQFK